MTDRNKALRRSLTLLSLAMALPIAALIWHAYSQLKWESFHHLRLFAEELSSRIDGELQQLIENEQIRPVSDYVFVSPEQFAAGGYSQRSALSVFPLTEHIAGTLGYFQIDGNGVLTSPVVPSPELDLDLLGLPAEELLHRQQIIQSLHTILSLNQLLDPADANDEVVLRTDADITLAVEGVAVQEETRAAGAGSRPRTAPQSAISNGAAVSEASRQTKRKSKSKSQIAFEKLITAQPVLPPAEEQSEAVPDSVALTSSTAKSDSVSSLALDFRYELESSGGKQALEQPSEQNRERAIALANDQVDERSTDQSSQNSYGGGFGNNNGPVEFSRLSSGHFILFRRVWSTNERLIQGLLIDRERFLQQEIAVRFRSAGLSDNSNLVVAFNDDILANYASSDAGSTVAVASDIGSISKQDTLLYRRSLSTPLGSLQLIYTVNELPPGPGGGVLAWFSLVVASVFCGGFYFLYRLGLKQIALSTQQQNFVSSVSHELKTPLTSIRMYSEMLQAGWADEPNKQRYYQYIHDESERLSRLISNVLRLANMQNSESVLELQRVEISQLMQHIQDRISTLPQAIDRIVMCEIKPDLAKQYVNIDFDSFTQVLINLIDNAVKFSNSALDSRIELRCEAPFSAVGTALSGPRTQDLASEHYVQFAVRDYGPGVPKEQLKKIFELFYRPEDEMTRETVGTGIGLAIVSQLSAVMHGSVDAVNKNPGAEFRVRLPLYDSPISD